MRIILVRHGETIYNLERRYQGHTDAELTELGKKQALRTAERLSREDIAAIYSSDLIRASETASTIAKCHNLPVQTDMRLRECAFGDWEGLTVDEIKERYPELYANYQRDSVQHRAPNGERLESLLERVSSVVNRIVKKHPNETVVLVGHGGTIHAFICYALDAPLYAFRKIRLDNCGITIFSRLPNGKWFLEVLNETCHLEGLVKI
ncbi:MAG: alpha-ribazole phosphatase [Armatimonadetes bacterium]|nr:alpha-ribazole phosphatase [Armatimonadota bacterium]